MRAVIDTNVLVSALFWHGTPHLLLERVREGELGLISSSALIDELARGTARPKFAAVLTESGVDRWRALAEVQELAEVFEPTPLSQRVCRDPDDDSILALAIAARADVIVSGDQDLLLLGSFRGRPIVPPVNALRLLERERGRGAR